jgi:hypothetical protein
LRLGVLGKLVGDEFDDGEHGEDRDRHPVAHEAGPGAGDRQPAEPGGPGDGGRRGHGAKTGNDADQQGKKIEHHVTPIWAAAGTRPPACPPIQASVTVAEKTEARQRNEGRSVFAGFIYDLLEQSESAKNSYCNSPRFVLNLLSAEAVE